MDYEKLRFVQEDCLIIGEYAMTYVNGVREIFNIKEFLAICDGLKDGSG